MNSTMSPAAALDALRRARAESPFLAMLLNREPELAGQLAAGQLPDVLARDGHGESDGNLSVMRRLRLQRRRLALTVAIGDLAGALDLTAVTAELTEFADQALDSAIAAAIGERTPGAEPVGFTAIALGKQGSRELNYSSDIDPILLFDPATLPRRPREEPEEAAVRIGRRVVEILQARDGDGYVLRVDLRLRPSPEATPIVLPVDAAISYYESLALPWERAAFIRARAAAGDVALGQRFLDAIRPFVWRRSLDFGAVGEIRAISRRIRDHYADGQQLGPGYDLKRGRGGIREVEFFAQVHQLIHGGRDPTLRAPATRDALTALAAAGWIEQDTADFMIEAYTLLRTIEHRVQMIDDRQTHVLPKGEALSGVARLHGLASGSELLDRLRGPTQAVARRYDVLAADDADQLPRDANALAAVLAEHGLAEHGLAAESAAWIAKWRSGAYPAVRSPAAQDALEAVLPVLITALAAAPDPRRAVVRLDTMLSRQSSAINFFRLLEARPALTQLLARILSHAEPLAEALSRRPMLFDGLIDATALDAVGSVTALAGEMRGLGGYEDRLDRVRQLVGEKRFALGAQIIVGQADPLAVAAGYARVAEAALQVLTEATVIEFERAHGRVPDSELVIVALGRLGGGALTQASDLDLVMVFTGDHLATSDGLKPLGAVQYYNRLAQRVTGALSAPTTSGALYAIDTRLRPSGAQGPLCVSLDGFERYQRESAWTWEHMALARSRPIFGSAAARDRVAAIVTRILSGDRPARDVPAEALAMRIEMARHKPPAGPLDVKLLPGGLVDLEFAIHVLQLTRHRGLVPDLRIAILELIAAGLAPEPLLAAHDLLTRLLVTMRLVAPDAAEPDAPTRQLIAQTLHLADWAAVIACLADTRHKVTAFWREVSGAG